MFVELRKLKSCIRTWENEEKRKRAKGGVAQVQLQGVPHVQCPMRRPAQVTPHLRYSNKLDISLPAPCSTRYSDCSYVRYLFIPRRISSRCTLCRNRYRSGVQCCTAGGGGLVLADIGLKWSQSGYPIQASSWPWVPLSVSAPLQYRFSHMFVHCANISRSKSKLWSICNSVHVCHLFSLCRQSCASGWRRFTLHCPYMHHPSSEHCSYNYIWIIFVCWKLSSCK